jgi:hypothetical protein
LKASHDFHRFSNRPNLGDATAEIIGTEGLITLPAVNFAVDSLPSQGAEFPINAFHTRACEGLQTKTFRLETPCPLSFLKLERCIPQAGPHTKSLKFSGS